MTNDNLATRLNRELLIHICEMQFNGTLEKNIDHLPIELRPRGMDSSRCCIYHDRAVIKHRCMTMLGTPVEHEIDELTPLSQYARQAKTRAAADADPNNPPPVLSVLDEACAGCVRSQYSVTNACRGCLASPCTLACPKNAVEMRNGQAHIDPEQCINCGKCLAVCPYHAIVYIPIPCAEVCPVGAISRSDNGKQHIDEEACIHCGKCKNACPFGAVLEVSQLIDTLEWLSGPQKTIAMFAPALSGQFKATNNQIIASLSALGFDEVLEVAWGAEKTARIEAQEFTERMEEGHELMTTSCCPAWTAAVEKHLTHLQPLVSDAPTPLQITAAEAKRRWPDAKTVFVSPCVAKRQEACNDENVNSVLSFEEFGAALVARGVDVECQEPQTAELMGESGGRGFAVSGGVTHAMADHLPEGAVVTPRQIDGLDRKSMKLLKVMPKARGTANFLEVMGCQGGCVAGPSVICSSKVAEKRIASSIVAQE